MNITEIHEHKVCLDLLTPGSAILDIGCLGFLFSDHFKALGHDVISVDIQNFERKDYIKTAISGHNGFVGVAKTNDPQATHIVKGNEIECITIETLMKRLGVYHFDLIKIDVEGSELEIINSLTRPLAKQISCEFHLHTGIYSRFDVDNMVAKLVKLGYKIASHELTNQHGAGFNYWSSLFVL